MDKLIKISGAHKEISEMAQMYKELISRVDFYDPMEYSASLGRIFKDTILPHFEFEEKEVFPLLFSRENNEGIQNNLSELLDEHGRIKEKFNRINELRRELEAAQESGKRELLLSLCTEITRELNEHALKEDAFLFPLLKDSGFTG